MKLDYNDHGKSIFVIYFACFFALACDTDTSLIFSLIISYNLTWILESYFNLGNRYSNNSLFFKLFIDLGVLQDL